MKNAVVLGLVIGAGFSMSASAALTVYTDRASWEAALGTASITEDFNSLAPPITIGEDDIDGSLALTHFTLSFNGNGNGSGSSRLKILDGGSFGNINGTNFVDGFTGTDGSYAPASFTVDFNSAGVFAFGADWHSPGSGAGIGLMVGSDFVSLLPIGSGDSFFGVISDTAFGSLDIVRDGSSGVFGEVWSADDFSFAVPAPASMALLGLTGLAATRRRR